MMVVVAIVGLIVGIAFPGVSAGLDSVRLASATDSLASFLNAAVNRAERLQQPIQVEISPAENRLTMTSPGSDFTRELKLPDGIALEAEGPSSLLLLPGAAVPGISLQFANRHGGRRILRLDPMTGYPRVESVAAK